MPLQLSMERHAKMVAHHERHKESPGRFYPLGDIEGNRDRNCRDAALFDSALNQRDGLMSYWSCWSQQDNIGVLALNRLGDVFRKSLLQSFRVHVVANERVEIVG